LILTFKIELCNTTMCVKTMLCGRENFSHSSCEPEKMSPRGLDKERQARKEGDPRDVGRRCTAAGGTR
jgi:hypothetical protein